MEKALLPSPSPPTLDTTGFLGDPRDEDFALQGVFVRYETPWLSLGGPLLTFPQQESKPASASCDALRFPPLGGVETNLFKSFQTRGASNHQFFRAAGKRTHIAGNVLGAEAGGL